MVEIIVEKGGVEIHRSPVEGDLTIGRAAHAQVRLDDMRVHRAHARLLWQDGHLCVLDLDTSNGTMLDGRRIQGIVRFEGTARVEIGPFTLRRSDVGVANPALDEDTGSDEDSGLHAAVTPRAEVLDANLLEASLPRVRVGRHFVFIDDATQALPATDGVAAPRAPGRRRLTSYKQRRGRAVKALADASVDVAGARIHAAPFDVERLAALTSDSDRYRAGHDVARLIVAMPGGGRAMVRVTCDGAPLFAREVDVGRGIVIEPVPLLERGHYVATLEVGGVIVGEPVLFFAEAVAAQSATAGNDGDGDERAPSSAAPPRGELGKELTVALEAPRDRSRATVVRGLYLSRRDHLATPIVVDDVVAERASLRAVEDLECLVVAAFDPARDSFTVFELGDVARGARSPQKHHARPRHGVAAAAARRRGTAAGTGFLPRRRWRGRLRAGVSARICSDAAARRRRRERALARRGRAAPRHRALAHAVARGEGLLAVGCAGRGLCAGIADGRASPLPPRCPCGSRSHRRRRARHSDRARPRSA